MKTLTITAKQDSYFDRNSPWIIPAWCVFMTVMTPLLVTAFDVQIPLPVWLIQVMAVVGSLWTGFRSMQVNTLSAKLIQIVCAAVVIGLVLNRIFG